MRLQKFLRQQNLPHLTSLRKCDEWVQSKKIKVNGQAITTPTYYLQQGDEVQVANSRFKYESEDPEHPISPKHYFKFHKPPLVLSSHKSQGGKKTIFDLLCHSHSSASSVYSDVFARGKTPLFYAGRLDYDAKGLMILSDDGNFIHQLTHPSYGVDKEYVVTTQRDLDFKLLCRLSRKGYQKGEIKYAPFKLEKISNRQVKMTLKEGRKNEIKNIIALSNNRVSDLLRIRIGDYHLAGLKERGIEKILSPHSL